MTVDLRNLPAYLNNDGNFRAWGSGISAQLAAVGLVKTTDAGQVNWATVPGASAGGFTGYEIWRFNDSLQATKPVFIKIEFGAGGLGDRPALRIQVATATDGAGTLSGQVGAQRSLSAAASKSTGIMLPSYCSGSPNRLNLINNFDNATSSFAMVFMLERTKSADGVSTDDGTICWSQFSNNPGLFQVIPFSGSVPVGNTFNNALSFEGQLSMVGTKVALSPTVAFLGKPLFASWCIYRHTDIGELVPFTMEHLGEQHTFMPIGDGIYPTYLTLSGIGYTSMAMLWE